MKIIEKTYAWNGELSKRYLTKYIVLHHRAGNGDADSIHKQHVNNGWVGIGYHFYVRKDGSIYRGRPINSWGSHCIGYNDKTVGICFEGNFQDEKMPKVQLEAGQKLVDYLKGLYPEAEMRKHTELYPTACPGVNFPFNEIVKGAKKMTTKIYRVEQLTNDIENLYFARRYYWGVLAELEQLGRTHTKDFKKIEKALQTLNHNIRRLEEELADVETSAMLDEELEKLTAEEIEEFWN